MAAPKPGLSKDFFDVSSQGAPPLRTLGELVEWIPFVVAQIHLSSLLSDWLVPSLDSKSNVY